MNSIISDLMSFMLLTILSLSPCAVGNHMGSLVIMILGIHRMQPGWLDSDTPRRRSLCTFPFAACRVQLMNLVNHQPLMLDRS